MFTPSTSACGAYNWHEDQNRRTRLAVAKDPTKGRAGHAQWKAALDTFEKASLVEAGTLRSTAKMHESVKNCNRFAECGWRRTS
jgi:hypothetical protein